MKNFKQLLGTARPPFLILAPACALVGLGTAYLQIGQVNWFYFLLAVIAGYILLIGPLSYLVLRRLDRRELAWIVAPILVVIFSGVSYGIGASMKGSQIIVNQIAMVRTSTDGTAASVSTMNLGVLTVVRLKSVVGGNSLTGATTRLSSWRE